MSDFREVYTTPPTHTLIASVSEVAKFGFHATVTHGENIFQQPSHSVWERVLHAYVEHVGCGG